MATENCNAGSQRVAGDGEVFTYEAIADAYAAKVDTKVWNTEYDRPAVLSLLPSLSGIDVLDVGCGSGWYAEYFAEQGAHVTAVDITPKMVEFTRRRLGNRARVLWADIGKPLEFASSSFGLVVAPLVLHYLAVLEPTLSELYRVLKPGGVLVFSTHHPFADYRLFSPASYFSTELVEDTWDVGTVRFYRRPLGAITEALAHTGFVIERLIEPMPTEEFLRRDPASYERLVVYPGFLAVRARKDGGEL